MRQFIRHPAAVPVEIGINASDAVPILHTRDVGLGGLALQSGFAVAPGASVDIRIALVQPPFEAQARVAWCHPGATEGFELGMTFLDAQDVFRARMVEQVCHIEDYRQSVHRLEGRQLTVQEAAAEGIARHAAQFPDIGARLVQ